jgi:radical SAM protein with 4Fe4S-binding SPASM domain
MFSTKLLKKKASNAYLIAKQRIVLFAYITKHQGISFKKLSNMSLAHCNFILRRKKIRTMPYSLMIEPTNYCNLGCAVCPTGNNTLKRQRGFMDLELFKKIMDQTGPYIMNLVLYELGEPYMHKDFNEMVKYAKKFKPIRVVTSTNGHFIRTAEAAQKIIESGLDHIIISFDGATQETYQQYRTNGKLDLVIDAIKLIVEQKKKLNSRTPIIELQFIVFKHNEHEVDKITSMAKELGVDILILKSPTATFSNNVVEFSEHSEMLPTSERFNKRYTRIGGKLKSMFDVPPGCVHTYCDAVITWEGKAALCCFDYEAMHEMGDLTKTPFAEIWKGQKYENFRKMLWEQKENIPICKHCLGRRTTNDEKISLS